MHNKVAFCIRLASRKQDAIGTQHHRVFGTPQVTYYSHQLYVVKIVSLFFLLYPVFGMRNKGPGYQSNICGSKILLYSTVHLTIVVCKMRYPSKAVANLPQAPDSITCRQHILCSWTTCEFRRIRGIPVTRFGASRVND